MTAAEALARAEAAGVRLRLRPDGGVRLEADTPPPADLLAELRRFRGEVARLLVKRETLRRTAREGRGGGDAPPMPPMPPMPSGTGAAADVAPLFAGEHDAAEAAAMAQHYAAPPGAQPYLPGDPDPLRQGLLAGALMHPPAWIGAAPPPGAWCACCGRYAPQAGGRWWAPRHPRSDGTGTAAGWRCWTCHPPDHLAAADVCEVRT